MQLTGQDRQYWTNVEIIKASQCQDPIYTWSAMKDKLRDKYMPSFYYNRLLDDLQRFTQGTKSVKNYVAQFDVFLIHCNALGTESNAQVFFRFRVRLREDLRSELLARGVIELEKAYVLVQDVDVAKSSYSFRSQTQIPKSILSRYSNRFQAQMSSCQHKKRIPMIRTPKARALRRNSPKLDPQPNITCAKVMGI